MEVEMETESSNPLAHGDPDLSTGGDKVKEGHDESSSGSTEEGGTLMDISPPSQSISPSIEKLGELEEDTAETKVKCPVSDRPDDADSTTVAGGSEIKSAEKVIPELTVVLIGDTNSVETGSKNHLLSHDEQTEFAQSSSRLYDLCGRHISVVNMLGQQNAEELVQESVQSHIGQIVHEQGIHAFLLLLPNGQHASLYTSGVEWLEKVFGKGSLAFVMTVVTHESDEQCENALTDLKANSDFVEKRCHTCTKSMSDEKEIVALLEKIDVMVSENEPHCYSGPMYDEMREQNQHLKRDHKSQEERTSGSVLQTTDRVGELGEDTAETKVKCDPVSRPGDVKPSETNDIAEKADSTTVAGESEIKSVKSSDTNERGTIDEDAVEDKEKAGKRKKSKRRKKKNSEEIRPVEQRDIATVEDKEKCDPVSRPGDVKPSETNDIAEKADSTTVAGESEIKSVKSSDTNERGTIDEDTVEDKEKAGKRKKSKRRKKKNSEEIRPVEQRDSTTVEDKEKAGKRQQSVKNSEEIRPVEQRDIEALLSRLHLKDKYQQKLTPADLLKIGQPVKQSHKTSEEDLAHTFLQRLMMLDHRARYIQVEEDSTDGSHSPDVVDVAKGESDLDVLINTSQDSSQRIRTHVHPMDVQMAVFHCSDSFLRQNMITKLSQCQYALPLLVPDPFTADIECPLWTFRQIRKSWKPTDKSNVVTIKSMPICKAETPMVSFFCLGSVSLSKSHIINTLINERHSTFFHRNCPGSTKSRYLMDGVAEIAWYCPAGKPTDTFTDCIAFCNLHGDALSSKKQRDILIEKASVNVVLLLTPEKGDKNEPIMLDLLNSPKPLICLLVDNDTHAVKIKEGKYKIGLKDKSQSDVSEELKGIIRKILSGRHTSFQLDTMANVSGIRVDENDQVCQKGKSAADQMLELLQGMDLSEIKDKFLPCQGQLWHKWCKEKKELHCLKGQIEKEKCKKQKELKEIRRQQCDASSSQLMQLFIENLQSLSSNEKMYFLKWIGFLLDDLSTDDFSEILHKYDEKWSEVLALKKKHDKSEQLKEKQIELEKISATLQSATVGFEHIVREMAQLYEAYASLSGELQGKNNCSNYPELAAELMISGHPIELMDGDAAHVPLTWITSVLDEVIKKLRDPRVFVLSVLGIQSSGKSTMLNSMFGLQFAVSAGRCTKGAFMQLVKVSEKVQEDFKFDYVLVVDTEGLRALELAGSTTLHHDNELATFVIGLGNMTLINIFGENPAEMQDILQIAVQAFMRMRKVKLSPSCVFVHQNVTDIGAVEKNMEGKRRLQEKLDKMTQLAAKEEVFGAECFSEVIAFDVQEDVKYFAQLWEGSPPMAPPNPGYSESIQELKNLILSKAAKSSGMTFSHFKSSIQDLWNALLNEHFVFSFKNTLEIAVYRKLEVQYGNWTWDLRSAMLTTENKLHNRIENGKFDKVHCSDLDKEMSNTRGKVEKAMKKYFDDDRDKEMLVQWRGRFETKIKDFHDEQVKGVQRRLEEVIQQKNACKKLDDKKTEFENNLLQKSKELAHKLKDKAKDEKELENEFNSVWKVWVTELTEGTPAINDIDIQKDEYAILIDIGIEWSLFDDQSSDGRYKNISEIGNYDHYITTTNQKHLRKTGLQWATNVYRAVKTLVGAGGLPHEEQERIRSLIDNVEKQSRDIIESKPVATRGYNISYLHEIAKNVKEKVTEFVPKHTTYALKNEFTVDLLLYVFDIARMWLTESHNEFKKNNDAVTYLESKKMQYYALFGSFCKGSSSAAMLGELMCSKLKDPTVQAVCNKTAIELAGVMKSNSPPFSGNRSNLEKHILRSLAEQEDFGSYMNYIKHPRKQVECFIKQSVKKYIFTEHKDEALSILKKNAKDIVQCVRQAVYAATEKVKTQGGDTGMWLEEFSSLLKDVLIFDTNCCQNFTDINNFDFLKEEMEKGLAYITEEISSLSLLNMEELWVSPDKILIDQLCTCCWVQCPFCSAICTNTLADHSPDDHSVSYHRPAGINGWHFRNTVEMDIDFCTTSVASDGCFRPHHDSERSIPYKQYKTAGPEYENWSITPDNSKLTYWKWFVCHFQSKLEEYYKKKFQDRGEIPKEWREHDKEEAIKSLDNM